MFICDMDIICAFVVVYASHHKHNAILFTAFFFNFFFSICCYRWCVAFTLASRFLFLVTMTIWSAHLWTVPLHVSTNTHMHILSLYLSVPFFLLPHHIKRTCLFRQCCHEFYLSGSSNLFACVFVRACANACLCFAVVPLHHLHFSFWFFILVFFFSKKMKKKNKRCCSMFLLLPSRLFAFVRSGCTTVLQYPLSQRIGKQREQHISAKRNTPHSPWEFEQRPIH